MKQKIFERVIDIEDVSSVAELMQLCTGKGISYESMVTSVVGYHDYDSPITSFGFYREETDCEYLNRTNPEAYKEILQERMEFQHYLELKKKFEHKTDAS